MDNELQKMVNVLIDEMGRMENRINKRMDERFEQVERRFDKIEWRLDSKQHELNTCKVN